MSQTENSNTANIKEGKALPAEKKEVEVRQKSQQIEFFYD